MNKNRHLARPSSIVEHKRFKLYKDGKFWVTALAGITFSMTVFSTPISADTTGDTPGLLSTSSYDKSIDEQKKSAENVINSEAIKISDNINNDKFLSQTDKDNQNQAVTNAATKAKSNIDQATANDGINNAQINGITDIDNQYTPAQSDISQDKPETTFSDQDNSNKIAAVADSSNQNTSNQNATAVDSSNQNTGNQNTTIADSSNQDNSNKTAAVADSSKILSRSLAVVNTTAKGSSAASINVTTSQNNAYDPTDGAITVAVYGAKKVGENTYAGTVVVSFDPVTKMLYGMKYNNDKTISNRTALTSSSQSFGLDANLIKINLNTDGTYNVIGNSAQNPTVALLRINDAVYNDRSWKSGYKNQPTLVSRNITTHFIDKTTGTEIQPSETTQKYSSQNYNVAVTTVPDFYTVDSSDNATGSIRNTDITTNIYFQRNKVTIDTISTSQNIATGTGFPGEKINIIDSNNTIIGSSTVDAEGHYTVSLSRYGNENEKLTANSYNSENNTLVSSAETVVTFDADNAKNASKNIIDKEAAKVTADIKNDPTLSQADKDKQTQAVADAAT
ncbi:Ig-like domain-containing protein, partial [Weissella confusa]